jgi:protein gp37
MTDPAGWQKGRIVAVCLLSDLFHPAIPDRWRYEAFTVMRVNPQHDYIILTKRARAMADFVGHLGWEEVGGLWRFVAVRTIDPAPPLPNVCFMTTAESDLELRERLPWLLATPAAMRGLSIEPLLGPVEVGEWLWNEIEADDDPATWLHWVIVGGETGGPAERALVQHVGDMQDETGLWMPDYQPKPDALAWVRKMRDDCAEMGIAYYFKNWGGAHSNSHGAVLDGKVHRAYPAAFRNARKGRF